MTWNPLKLRRMVAIGGALLMAGCAKTPAGPQGAPELSTYEVPNNVAFYTRIIHDEITGCEYIVVDNIPMPRMQANGQQRCVR